MSNAEQLVAALDGLPEWNPSDDDAVTDQTKVIKVFTPDANATWFLAEKDTSNAEYVRYFGLCDLGLGFPELGWVGHNELMTLRGQFGLPVELDVWFEGRLKDGYTYVNR